VIISKASSEEKAAENRPTTEVNQNIIPTTGAAELQDNTGLNFGAEVV
jgi:hypothetical protein